MTENTHASANHFSSPPISNAAADFPFQSPNNASIINLTLRSPKVCRIKMKELTADIVAHEILRFCFDHGDTVTNLHLQRILYYVQAWYLALHGSPLFSEDFEAWECGPIERTTYNKYLAFNGGPITIEFRNIQAPKSLASHINDVMEAYGSLSSFDLERLSKDEEPWKIAHATKTERAIINKDVMKGYYKLKLINGKS